MTTEKIVEWVIAIIPSIIAIITTLTAILKVLKQFKDVKADVADMKCIEELKEEIKQLLEENYALKKAINETLTKIDHVQRD